MGRDRAEAKTSKVTFEDQKDKDTQRLLKQIRDTKYALDRAEKARDEAQSNVNSLSEALEAAEKEYSEL